MMTVTAVIPVRNRERLIARALESVISQTIPPTEIIVVDDASTDETPHVIERLAKAIGNLILIRLNEKVGAAKARNIGAEIAKGDFLAFLDSDDRWYPEKTEKQMNEFKDDKDIVAVFCGLVAVTGNSSTRHIPPGDLSLNALYRAPRWLINSAAIISKKAFAEVGGFDASLPSCQDWDLCIRLAEIGKIRVVQQDLLEYCNGSGDRISNNRSDVIRGHNIVFDKIYRKLSSAPDPLLNRTIRGGHESILAELFYPDEPNRALPHALRGFLMAPSPRKLRLAARVVGRAIQIKLIGAGRRGQACS